MGLTRYCRIWLGMGDISRFASSSACLKNEQDNFSALHYSEPPIRFADAKLRALKCLRAKIKTTQQVVLILAGDEGFEPPITGPEPVALPLGQSPICLVSFMSLRTCFVMFWSRTGLIIIYSVVGPRTTVAFA